MWHADTNIAGEEEESLGDKTTTRERILDTALLILGRDGIQGLTTRAIAEQAGINQALINYHFRTKRNLLLEMFLALESDKYARQWRMYQQPDIPLSKKWWQAVEFYRKDLEDGFIRINHELQVIAITDPVIAEHVTERWRRWIDMLQEVADFYLPPLNIHAPPAHVASAVSSLWLGMDTHLLVYDPEDPYARRIFEYLDYIGDWLEKREHQYGITQDS